MDYKIKPLLGYHIVPKLAKLNFWTLWNPPSNLVPKFESKEEEAKSWLSSQQTFRDDLPALYAKPEGLATFTALG